MSDGTKISWTDATWSPVTGCTKTSEGCLRCYIDRTPPFRMAHRKFDGPGIGATTGVKLHSERLHIPLKWRTPRMIFVCSLADLFQDEVPDQFIADVFAVISIGTQHIFQVLTKRHARLRSLLNSPHFWALVDGARQARGHDPLPGDAPHVLENAWIGVSTENQKWADIRIPALLQTPAAVRWISAEPLLGPIDLTSWTTWTDGSLRCPKPEFGIAALNWVVCGGESGPNARPMSPEWARSLRDQCVSADVAYHFKQWGEWSPDTTFNLGEGNGRRLHYRRTFVDGTALDRVGKKAAGRLLDGREWSEFPA
jgi:protein gp37